MYGTNVKVLVAIAKHPATQAAAVNLRAELGKKAGKKAKK
jgi:hypothetical protein